MCWGGTGRRIGKERTWVGETEGHREEDVPSAHYIYSKSPNTNEFCSRTSFVKLKCS